jgi:hypothetical protein
MGIDVVTRALGDALLLRLLLHRMGKKR